MSELKKLFMLIFGLIVLIAVLDRADSVTKIEHGTSTFIDSLIQSVQGRKT